MKAYFKLTSGPVFALIKEFADKNKEAEKALRAWIKEKGLPVEMMRGKSLKFEEGHDPNRKMLAWKKNKHGYWLPRGNTASGKALQKELDALPDQPSVFNLVCDLGKIGGGTDIMRINQTGYPGLFVDGDDVRLHIDDYWLPKEKTGMIEVTASEYHAKSKS